MPSPPLPRAAVAAAAALIAGLTPGAAAAAPTDAFSSALAQGPVAAGLAAFVGGLAVSLTPCVYPMVAVTVSVFGARQAGGRLAGLLLSSAFVAGIVAMFVPLGVVAGLSGAPFGSVLSSPWVIGGISVLFLALAASMLGAFELTLGSWLTNRLAQLGGTGPRGAFLLGLACGPIAAPCSGPVLTGILLFIAQTRDPVLGAGAMATFALGLGVPFFLVGAFALQLPKGGRWMLHVKSALGLVLIVAALYFAATAFPAVAKLVPSSTTALVVYAAVAALGLALGAVHRSFEEPGSGVKIAKGAGILLASVAAFAALTAATTPERTLEWAPLPYPAARAQAVDATRPLLVDFTASWCAACKELDKLTFADPAVSREAGRFVAVKVDATNEDEPAVAAAMRELRVVGLPTVVLLDSTGKEQARFTDFVEAGPFLEALRGVR
ncbi:MAG: thioredoxin family protein [Polyangiaceae bacterium]|nr:thioredoxin family protein [Polyangiaceae bacterium]